MEDEEHNCAPPPKKIRATISSCTNTNENHLANLLGPTLDPSGHNEDNEEPQLPINNDEDEKGATSHLKNSMDVNNGGSFGEEKDKATSFMFATNRVSFFWYLELFTNYEMQIVKKSTTQNTLAHCWRSKDKDAEGTKSTISRKITQKHFTPRTRHLALISQSHLWMCTALGDVFSSRALEARWSFILNLISTATKETIVK